MNEISSPQAGGYEHDRALMEGHRNAAVEAYFKARHPMLDRLETRRVYEAAYAQAWKDQAAVQDKPIGVIDDDGNAWAYGVPGGKFATGTVLYGRAHSAAPGAAAAAPSQDAEDARAMAFANHLAEMFMRIPRFNYGYRSDGWSEDGNLGPIPSAEGRYVLYSEVTGILLSAARLLKEQAAARTTQQGAKA